MASPYERMRVLTDEGTPFAVATVVRTQGSTPQVVGAKLIVTADQATRPFGTLGGGCVEADAIDAAREVLAGAPASIREYRLTEELAWNTGLVCGGTMWILAERGDTATTLDGRDVLADAVAASRGGEPLAFVTRLTRGHRAVSFGGRLIVTARGDVVGPAGDGASTEELRRLALDQMTQGTPRLVTVEAGDDLLIEPVTSRPQLVVAGGGHVSKAIARQARLLDFDITILEDRPEFADPQRFDGATVLAGDVPSSIAAFAYGPQTYLVIATRGHKLDADCVVAAVKTDVRYIGLLGSRRKTVLIEDMLREIGVDASRGAVIHAPVGLDLGGRTPAEIALSVLAEITQIRYGGLGKPLRGPRDRVL
ncbi:MAG: XdhC family protein [Acidobacteriota bacterium]